jgi:hypothetical protein
MAMFLQNWTCCPWAPAQQPSAAVLAWSHSVHNYALRPCSMTEYGESDDRLSSGGARPAGQFR